MSSLLLELPDCVAFNIVFRRIARSIIYSELEEEVDLTYVDFTDSPDDAKLNVSEINLLMEDIWFFECKQTSSYVTRYASHTQTDNALLFSSIFKQILIKLAFGLKLLAI